MTQEHVYVLHKYAPEFDDELALEVGERIMVMEKDDEHGDGWWTGRNAAGQVGLFPKNYTSGDPLVEASRSTTPKSGDKNDAARQYTDFYATINDQLFKPLIPVRLSKASSLAISEISSADTADEDEDDVERFKKVRARLAERARLQLEEARACEEDFGLDVRLPAIDVDIETSESGSEMGSAERERLFDDDESGDDAFMRVLNTGAKQSTFVDLTPQQSSFIPENVSCTASPEPLTEDVTMCSTPSPPTTATPTPTKTAFSSRDPPSLTVGLSEAIFTRSSTSSPSLLQSAAPIHKASSPVEDNASALPVPADLPCDPLAWTVAEVVTWLQSREFDDEICIAFREQDVSGDVLFALNIDVLRTDFGISTLGKRMRIMAEIVDLTAGASACDRKGKSPAVAATPLPTAGASVSVSTPAGSSPSVAALSVIVAPTPSPSATPATQEEKSPLLPSPAALPSPDSLPTPGPLSTQDRISSPTSPPATAPPQIPAPPAQTSYPVSSTLSNLVPPPGINSAPAGSVNFAAIPPPPPLPGKPRTSSPASATLFLVPPPPSLSAVHPTAQTRTTPPSPPLSAFSSIPSPPSLHPASNTAAASTAQSSDDTRRRTPSPQSSVRPPAPAGPRRYGALRPPPQPSLMREESFHPAKVDMHSNALVARAAMLPRGAARPAIPGAPPPFPEPQFYTDVLRPANGAARRAMQPSAQPAPVFRAPRESIALAQGTGALSAAVLVGALGAAVVPAPGKDAYVVPQSLMPSNRRGRFIERPHGGELLKKLKLAS